MAGSELNHRYRPPRDPYFTETPMELLATIRMIAILPFAAVGTLAAMAVLLMKAASDERHERLTGELSPQAGEV